jgi:hypothetical protein
MARPVILFKAPVLSVQAATEADGHPWPPGTILLVARDAIPLDPNAVELLVGYLRVARAYFSPLPGSKKLIAGFYAGLARQLAATLAQSGRQVAAYQDIANLIQQAGCLTDWQQQYPPAG